MRRFALFQKRRWRLTLSSGFSECAQQLITRIIYFSGFFLRWWSVVGDSKDGSFTAPMVENAGEGKKAEV
jgi:hypothetical protein